MNDIIERYQSGEGIKCTTKHSEDSHEHVENIWQWDSKDWTSL